VTSPAARIARNTGQRLISALPALFGVVLFTFLLMRVMPGDPSAYFVSGPNTGPAEVAMLRREMGLDQPLYLQFPLYLRDIASGNLGYSLSTGQPVAKDLLARLPASLELTFAALLLAWLVAVPLGVVAALWRDSVLDQGIRLFCALGVCTPTFVTGLVLIYVFYHLLGWAPPPIGRIDSFALAPPKWTGFLLVDSLASGDGETFRSALSQLALPAVTMALFVTAPLARVTRAAMIAVLGSDYIRTAEAIGLPGRKIIAAYAFRNALLPVLTIAGIVFSTMLGANVLVEKVFSWPGVASYALDALISSDYAPVQGFVLLMALLFVILNLIVDVLYGWADPRVSVG
jgi:peptide/nickel transport system permease protein